MAYFAWDAPVTGSVARAEVEDRPHREIDHPAGTDHRRRAILDTKLVVRMSTTDVRTEPRAPPAA
jgi:hypothetical protein